jgi:hypothetical protein
MTGVPKEETHVHGRILKCALEVEDARACWTHAGQGQAATAQRAFDEYWFGAKSLPRIEVLLTNMRARFDAFPGALETLHRWPHMSPDTPRVICHWHLQSSDPLYRGFTGEYLVARRMGPRAEVTRDLVVGWIGEHGVERWTMATRIQSASKMLSAAHAAGLVTSARDPRPLETPRVPDEALEYLMYLLRGIQFEGTLLGNPYVASVGLDGGAIEDRLRALPRLMFRRQGDLIDFGWKDSDLTAWADACFGRANEPLRAAR